MKLAVASKDGLSINVHFGHAKRFAIYEVSSTACWLVEERDVAHYCHGDQGSASAMEMILHTIADCRAVLIAKIGDGPVDKLAAKGIEAVCAYAYEAIEPSLLDYALNASPDDRP